MPGWVSAIFTIEDVRKKYDYDKADGTTKLQCDKRLYRCVVYGLLEVYYGQTLVKKWRVEKSLTMPMFKIRAQAV